MLSRIAAARRVPRIVGMSVRNTSSQREGSVAQSQGFNKKEKAHEDQYIRAQEQASLKKLKDQIEAKKAELAKLEEEHHEVSKKV